MILAVEECDFVNEPVCAPAEVSELFVFTDTLWNTPITRTIFLMGLAALIVVALLYFAYRNRQPPDSHFWL